jgi:hypothetical protein
MLAVLDAGQRRLASIPARAGIGLKPEHMKVSTKPSMPSPRRSPKARRLAKPPPKALSPTGSILLERATRFELATLSLGI